MLRPYFKKDVVEAGCDEAGRGSLAGPVFAAAVILAHDFKNELLNDSKLLNQQERNELRIIIEKDSVSWGVAYVDNMRIDSVNILNASFLAMHKAIEQLKPHPEHLVIDGNRFHDYKKIAYDCVIKGDGKYMSIAAASILAKTHRDEYMHALHDEYPDYSWNTNVGYPTDEHRQALRRNGPTPYHRRSFRLLPLPKQASLF